MQAALSAAFPVTAGWFNGHCRRNDNGEYVMDCFPIPEISVTGVCDVELHFDTIIVTTKLTRETALMRGPVLLADVPFEAYGVEDYLLDFRREGMPVEAMRESILRSDEKEVFFSFSFDADVSSHRITAFVKQLIDMGFYY